jgi:hypothetical protein
VAAVAGAGATPSGAATQLNLSPSTGSPGSTFTVTGSGFAAVDVEIHWDSQSGPLLSTAAGPSFTITVTVPDDALPNSHPVLAVAHAGTAVSTSTAAFQVTGAPVETTTTVVDTTTSVATVPSRSAAPPATTDPAGAGAGGVGAGGGASRAASGVTGGIDPSALETTTGEATPPPAPGAASVSPSTPAPSGETTTTAATAAPSGGGTLNPAAPAPGVAASGADRGPAGQVDAAAGATPARQSSAAVRSPGLLVLGLVLTLAGAAALAVRSRRRPPAPDIPFTS